MFEGHTELFCTPQRARRSRHGAAVNLHCHGFPPELADKARKQELAQVFVKRDKALLRCGMSPSYSRYEPKRRTPSMLRLCNARAKPGQRGESFSFFLFYL